MNPKSNASARIQVLRLLLTPRVDKAGRYLSGESKRRLIRRAEIMADHIWRRFHVGIWRWQLKHVIWFFEVVLKGRSHSNRYQYWLTAERILTATEKGFVTDAQKVINKRERASTIESQ